MSLNQATPQDTYDHMFGSGATQYSWWLGTKTTGVDMDLEGQRRLVGRGHVRDGNDGETTVTVDHAAVLRAARKVLDSPPKYASSALVQECKHLMFDNDETDFDANSADELLQVLSSERWCSADGTHRIRQVIDRRSAPGRGPGPAPDRGRVQQGLLDKGVSGRQGIRPEWDKCLAYLREGDVLVSVKLDRWGRSVQHLLQVAADLEARGVGLRCLDQPIDTTTPVGKLVFTILAAVAEFERALIIERTQQGLIAARARGHLGGRPKSYTEQQCLVARMLRDQGGMTAPEIAELLGVSRATYFRMLKDIVGRWRPRQWDVIPSRTRGGDSGRACRARRRRAGALHGPVRLGRGIPAEPRPDRLRLASPG